MKYYSEETVKKIIAHAEYNGTFCIREPVKLVSYSSIELPDKHGRLIDEAKLRERAYAIQRRDRISFTDALAMALIEAETIVEATE